MRSNNSLERSNLANITCQFTKYNLVNAFLWLLFGGKRKFHYFCKYFSTKYGTLTAPKLDTVNIISYIPSIAVLVD